MPPTVATILDEVSEELFDPDRIRWELADLLAHFNTVRSEIISFKPDANTIRVIQAMVPTQARQTLPAANGAVFRRLEQWWGADGETAGGEITPVDMDDMDHCVSGWRSESGSAVRHFIPDPSDPLAYYIYPLATGSAELIYSGSLADATDLTDDFGLADIYRAAAVAGVLALAYGKNSKLQDVGRASYWRTRMLESLGMKAQGQSAYGPKPAAIEQRMESP